MQVQNANAVSGFVHSSLSPTQTLGFTHALGRRLKQKDVNGISLKGCALIVRENHTQTYKDDKGTTRFTKSRNQPCIYGVNKFNKPYVTENATMNLTLSLLIAYEGDIDNEEIFCKQVESLCYHNRMGGGTILRMKDVRLTTIEESGRSDDSNKIRELVRSLLPGFVLHERSDLLAMHKQQSKQSALATWFDYISLKQYAVPKHEKIEEHFQAHDSGELSNLWKLHSEKPYQAGSAPSALTAYFDALAREKKSARKNKLLLKQWQEYCQPNQRTDAQWHYQRKPSRGFLVPMVCGYKAISPVYKNTKDAISVKNTRDIGTDTCFVEAVHSIGEWQSIHRIKTFTELLSTIWCYHYEENWYLCKQNYQPTQIQRKKQNRYI